MAHRNPHLGAPRVMQHLEPRLEKRMGRARVNPGLSMSPTILMVDGAGSGVCSATLML